MQWPRPETCAGQPGMPHMLLARQQSSRTSPRTSWVRPPMRSRPHVLPRRKERARAQGGSSAGGSVTSSRTRFASSYSTTSGCATTSAGRCSTAENAFHTRLDLLRHLRARPTTRSESVRVFVLPQGVGVVGLGFRCSLEQEADVRRDERVRRRDRVGVIYGAVLAREGDPARVLTQTIV